MTETDSGFGFLDRPVFVCGAPRSGTTLLMNLLDGHSNLFVLPHEVNILRYYYRYDTPVREIFFERDYCSVHDVALYIDRMFQQRINRESKLKNYGKKDPLLDLDGEAFLSTYRGHLNEAGTQLRSLFQALAKSLYTSLPGQLSPSEPDRFVVKRPMHYDIFAPRLKDEFPEATFIHLLRDPRTRYASAKKRRLEEGLFSRSCPSFERGDFATTFSEISMVSFDLAKRNRELLGEDYRIVKYETMTEDLRETMETLSSFLELEHESIMEKQSRFGEPQNPFSSFKDIDRGEVKSTHNKRLEQFRKLTSTLERKLLAHHVSEAGSEFGYEIEDTSLSVWQLFLPLKHENMTEYWSNRLSILNRYQDHNFRTNVFLNMLDHAENGKPIEY